MPTAVITAVAEYLAVSTAVAACIVAVPSAQMPGPSGTRTRVAGQAASAAHAAGADAAAPAIDA